jgi:hypothetical protein
MSFFRESVAAVLLVILTLWLQCAGLAALIFWVRRAVAGDLHRFGPVRSAALVVRLTAAVIVVHGVLILFGPAAIAGSASRRGNRPSIFRQAVMQRSGTVM